MKLRVKPDFTPRHDVPAIEPPVAKITPAVASPVLPLPKKEPKFFNWIPHVPIQEPAPPPPVQVQAHVQRRASPVPLPAPTQLEYSSFSPNMETFPSLGESYFLTDAAVQADVGKWSTFPAISDIQSAGYSFLGSVDGPTGTFENISGSNGTFQNINILGGTGTFGSVSGVTGTFDNLQVNSGTIVLSDTAGNQILQAIGTDLFYDGQLIAKASDLQNVSDWSLYPAIADVNMDNKQLLDVLNITPVDITDTVASQGLAGQVLSKSIDDNKMVWGYLPEIPESVTSLQGLTGSVQLRSSSDTVNITVAGQDIDLEVIFPDPQVAVDSLNLLTGDVAITSTGDTVTITKVGQNINLEVATPPPAGVASLNSVTGAVNLTSDGSVTITPSGQNIQLSTAVADVSQWANFDAVTRVNLNGNELTDGYGTVNVSASKITGGVVNLTANGGNDFISGFHGTVNLTANSGTAGLLTTGGLINLTANSGFNDVSFTSAIKMSAAGINSYAGAVPSVGSLAGYNFIYGNGGVNICTGIPSIFPNIPLTTYLYGTAGIVLNSDVYTTAIYPYWSGLGAPDNLSINGRNTLLGRAYVNLNNVDTLNFETLGNGGTGAITGLQSINGVPYTGSGGGFVDAYQIYVAPNGSATGTGSQQNPFLTIAQAITARATLSAAIEVSIMLSSGTYTENFTLVRNTFLVGIQTGEVRQPCNVVGTVTMSDTGGGTIGISGLEVTGTVTMTGVAGLFFTIFGCNISGSANSAVIVNSGVLFMTESRLSSSGANTIVSATGITVRDCVISQTGAFSAIVNSGGSTVIRQCSVTSTSTSTAPAALIQFTNAGNATCDLGFNRIDYTSSATDTVGNKCCIQFAGTGFMTASVFSSLLLCQGAITSSGGQIQCIQDTGTGGVNISYGALIAGATAHHISPNATKTQYTSVP